MEVNTELTRDGRVFIYRLSGELDLVLLKKLTAQWEAEILTPSPHPIYYISDFSGITRLPGGTLSSALNLAQKPSPKLKLNVMITNSMFINSLASVLSSLITTFKMQIVGSDSEALAIIDKALAEDAAKTAKKP